MRERASERGAKYDKNGDGALSKEEFAAMQADIFKGLDKNADGFLTSDELPAAAAPGQGGGAGPMLKRMDTDGDGRISKEEWRGREQLFVRLDRNGDGYIDAQEIPRDLVRPAGPQGGPGERLQMLKRMDTDHDGRISREEWRGAPERFDRLDRNGDGYIDRDDRDMR
jgi:Ca2+-binding EF-hand superfamily protein